MIVLRHAAIHLRSVVRYARNSGRWWLLVVALVWAVAAVLVATAHVAVPTAVYTLF